MKRILFVAAVIAGVVLAFGIVARDSQATGAEEECNYSWVLANPDGSKPTADQYKDKERREKECRQRKEEARQKGAVARERLKNEFQIDASKMSDEHAISLVNDEENRARQEKQEAEERKRMADQERREKEIDATMKQQNQQMDQMLKGMGFQFKKRTEEGEGGVESLEDDEFGEQMYQSMVDGGAAPQCKGKKGAALRQCVDQALGMGDEE